MKSTLLQISAVISTLALLFAFQNCSLQGPPDSGASQQSSVSNDITFQSVPSNIALYVGSAGLIEVQAVSIRSLPLTYRWYKNNAEIAGATSATFSIPSAALTDAGTYKVVVSNSTGYAQISINVTVSSIPVITITTQPQPITILGGATGSLTVAASIAGNLALQYSWIKDGTVIAGTNSPTLSLAAASAFHAGMYEVEISTSGGLNKVKSNAVKVTVQEAVNVQSATGCVNGYCACVAPGQLNVPHAPSALEVCKFRGYTTLVTFSTAAGARGTAHCNAPGTSCFINQNPGNITCSSVTCSK